VAGGRDAVECSYRALLDRRPVPAERLTVPTRAGDTFVLASGPVGAPPGVALQGSGANAAMWLPWIARWAHDLRVYAVDAPGEPGFSAPARLPLTTSAGWLDDVRAGLGHERVALAGVSLGGWTALDYAIRCPERVTQLVLLNPAGYRPAPAPRPGPGGIAGGVSEAGQAAHARRPHLRRRGLARLSMPVLTVVGLRDPMLDAAGTAARLRAVPTASVTVLPEAGHLVGDEGVVDFLRSGRWETMGR
jgi:pimeloyl-ACP methyl ester carboxylesterase